MDQVRIGLRQALFACDGNDLPVGLVHVRDDIGVGHVVFRCGQVGGIGGHLVGIDDFTAHEDRLLDGDGPAEEIVDVRMERGVDFLADGVDRSGDFRQAAAGAEFFQEGLANDPDRLFRRLPHGILQEGSHAPQTRRAILADQRDVTVVIEIGAGRRNFREIIRQGDFAVIRGHLDLCTGLVQGLGRGYGHLPAILQGQCPALGLYGRHAGYQQHSHHDYDSVHISTF